MHAILPAAAGGSRFTLPTGRTVWDHLGTMPRLYAIGPVLGAFLLVACRPPAVGTSPSDEVWPKVSGSIPPTPAYCHDLVGTFSIGEDLSCSTAVVLVRVDAIRREIWNAPDGNDWTAEYNAHPNRFVTLPVSVRPIKATVLHVYSSSGPLDAPGAPPSMEEGSAVTIYVPAAVGFGSDDRRIFFVRWTTMWLSVDRPAVLLLAQTEHSWVVREEDMAFPWNQEQRYSLISGARRGDIQLAGSTCDPTLSLDGFARLARRELVDDWPNLATFERWPWTPVYRQIVQHSDLPDELSDPDWCPPL